MCEKSYDVKRYKNFGQRDEKDNIDAIALKWLQPRQTMNTYKAVCVSIFWEEIIKRKEMIKKKC